MTFKAYMDNIHAKTGKTVEDFWKLASKKGFVKHGKIVAKHADLFGMAQVRHRIRACARKFCHIIPTLAH